MEELYYYSENGCIKIGNKSCSIQTLNGSGEGTYWIQTYEAHEIPNLDKYEFVSRIEGKDIKIYETDIGNRTLKNLKDGAYRIYRNKGNIKITQEKP